MACNPSAHVTFLQILSAVERHFHRHFSMKTIAAQAFFIGSFKKHNLSKHYIHSFNYLLFHMIADGTQNHVTKGYTGYMPKSP